MSYHNQTGELVEIMSSSERKGKLLIPCMIGFALYGIFNVLAMLLYPGGTANDQSSVGYSFLGSFFSDLGMIQTYAGEPNTWSSLLFASSLILVGVVLVLFSLLLWTYFMGSALGRKASKVGTMAGVASGLSCIGIALTPWDRFLVPHMVFAYGLSLSFLGVALFYAIAIFRNPDYPNGYAFIFVVYFAILLVFTGLMVLGPDPESAAGIRILAAGQKVCIYSGMACLFIQVIGAYRYTGGNEDGAFANQESRPCRPDG
jgi:hypothetical protein